MLWCKSTLNDVLLQHKTLPEREIQQKLAEIKRLNAQETMSQHLHLVLKQISLLLETLPELLKLKTELLTRDIKYRIFRRDFFFTVVIRCDANEIHL